MKVAFVFRPWVGAAVAAIACLVGTGTARADIDITIINRSFEGPAQGSGGGVGHTITGWDISGGGGAGVWDISNWASDPFWDEVAPHGNQVAFVSNAPSPGTMATISQVLTGNSLLNNMTYTLSGFVGHPSGGYGDSVGTYFTAELWAGSTLLATTGPLTGPDGEFETFTLTYTSTNSSPTGDLQIRLSSNRAQTAFDAISLTAVPEPSTLAMSGTALLFGLSYARRRARKTDTV